MFGLLIVWSVIISQTRFFSQAQDEIFNKIYTFIDTSDPCLLFLNSTGSVGCQGSGTRVSGAVIGAKNIDEFVGLIDEEGYTSDPVALVIDQTLLNKENLVKATKRYNIAGILVTDSADNFGYSPDRKSNFNIYGDGLRFERFQFPMFYIRAVDQIERLYRFSDFNKDSASRGKFLPYVVQFTFPALASQNSQTCLDNLKCFPVGDFSVWSTLSSSIQNSKEIVLVSTQLDSTSWFPYVGAPGAEAAASSSAALFGVAASLSQLSKELIESLPRQIFISFFQAESFDNIGSRRFIFDVDSFVCSKASKDGTACSQPIRTSLDFKKFSISNITRHFSISQIGLNNSRSMFIHKKRGSSVSSDLETLIKSQAFSDLPVKSGAADDIPPSTAIPFLERIPDLASVVISDFNETFTNIHYQSHNDLPDLVDINQICRAATLISRSVLLAAAIGSSNFSLYNETVAPSIEANCTLISTFFNCLTKNLNCDYSKQLNLKFDSDTTSLFPGTYTPITSVASLSGPTKFVYHALNSLTSNYRTNVSCSSNSDCSSLNLTCIQNYCANSLTRIHDAYGVGIEVDLAAKKFIVTNETFPIWTQSFSGTSEVRAFWRDPTSLALGMLFAGLAMIVASFYFSKKLLAYLNKKFKF